MHLTKAKKKEILAAVSDLKLNALDDTAFIEFSDNKYSYILKITLDYATLDTSKLMWYISVHFYDANTKGWFQISKTFEILKGKVSDLLICCAHLAEQYCTYEKVISCCQECI